jgi:hypothetical protein
MGMPKELNFMGERADEYIGLADKTNESDVAEPSGEIVDFDSIPENQRPELFDIRWVHGFDSIVSLCQDMSVGSCIALRPEANGISYKSKNCIEFDVTDDDREFNCVREKMLVNGEVMDLLIIWCVQKEEVPVH